MPIISGCQTTPVDTHQEDDDELFYDVNEVKSEHFLDISKTMRGIVNYPNQDFTPGDLH
jgi:hypothetical protein